MPQRGRPPKSIEQHVREGTLNPSRHKAKVPLVIGGRKKPKCPRDLSKDGKRMFRALVADMWDAGVLDHADWPMIMVAARFWELARQAATTIEEHGQTYTVSSKSGYTEQRLTPAVKIYHDALREYQETIEQLGVGPSARARLAGLGVRSKAVEKEVPGLATLHVLRRKDDETKE